MLKSALDTINKYALLSHGDKVVVGVSGGADSMALLDILCELQNDMDITVIAVHLNHCFRGQDADNDQKFVEDYCKKIGIPCESFKINVSEIAKSEGLTSEEAGRKVRYSLFDEVAKKHGANVIATAHHLNDNCETLLHNILRGSGLSGLCGIKPKRDKYVRPLIRTTRAQIEEYLISKGIPWCTDKTNAETDYTRNRIRHGLIPYIKENFNPSCEDALMRLNELCSDDNDFIDSYTKQKLKSLTQRSTDSSITLNRVQFNAEHIAVKRRLIRAVLERLCIPLKDVHMVHVDSCIKMMEDSQSGATSRISTCNVILEQDGATFYSGKRHDGFELELLPEQEIFIPEVSITVSAKYVDSMGKADANCVFVDADGIDGAITVRSRRDGDKLIPFGMNGTKKVKDIFIDKKIPLSQRNNIPIFVYNNKVIWVSGCCISDEFKITEHTRKILQLKSEQKGV